MTLGKGMYMYVQASLTYCSSLVPLFMDQIYTSRLHFGDNSRHMYFTTGI